MCGVRPLGEHRQAATLIAPGSPRSPLSGHSLQAGGGRATAPPWPRPLRSSNFSGHVSSPPSAGPPGRTATEAWRRPVPASLQGTRQHPAGWGAMRPVGPLALLDFLEALRTTRVHSLYIVLPEPCSSPAIATLMQAGHAAYGARGHAADRRDARSLIHGRAC